MHAAIGIIILALLAPSALTQSPLYTLDGNSIPDRFGTSVSGAGDVNGDGHADLIVGASGATPLTTNPHPLGNVQVFSGKDGALLYTFAGKTYRDVSGAGDVNNDGCADFIAGAPFDDNNGAVQVFSGKDGSVLYTFAGDTTLVQLGSSVSNAGDVNGDGYADIIAGSQSDDFTGGVRVFSGKDGTALYTINGAASADGFGRICKRCRRRKPGWLCRLFGWRPVC